MANSRQFTTALRNFEYYLVGMTVRNHMVVRRYVMAVKTSGPRTHPGVFPELLARGGLPPRFLL